MTPTISRRNPESLRLRRLLSRTESSLWGGERGESPLGGVVGGPFCLWWRWATSQLLLRPGITRVAPAGTLRTSTVVALCTRGSAGITRRLGVQARTHHTSEGGDKSLSILIARGLTPPLYDSRRSSRHANRSRKQQHRLFCDMVPG